MSWTIEYLEKDQIVHLKTSGTHTPTEIHQMAREALVVGKKHGVDRYLVDDRAMTPDFRTLELYKLPKNLVDLGVTKETRIAVVASSSSGKLADFQFFKDVAFTSGGPTVRLFEDSVELALHWLQARP